MFKSLFRKDRTIHRIELTKDQFKALVSGETVYGSPDLTHCEILIRMSDIGFDVMLGELLRAANENKLTTFGPRLTK